jgi:DNA polymerase I
MKTLLLIDAHALIHRSYHALPPLSTPEGEPIGAIYGLSSTLLKILKDHEPDYVAGAFDRPEPTFRKEMFEAYKAHRPPTEDELVSQLIKSRKLFEKFGIGIFDKPGFEGDDIIGSFVQKFRGEKDLRIVVLTGDLDTLQLVEGDHIVVQTMKKGIGETVVYDEAAVIERYGLRPDQMTDYKGLIGDQSDNIPGVKGIGPKSAEKLLKEYGNLEDLFEKITEKNPLHKKIAAYRDEALFSKKLATINRDIPFDVKLDDLAFKGLDSRLLTEYFTKLGFQSLVDRVFKQQNLLEERPIVATKLPKDVVVITGIEEALKEKKGIGSAKIKIAHDWHSLLKELAAAKTAAKKPLFDTEIAGWLLDPDQDDFSLEALSRRFLHRSAGEKEEVLKALFVFLNGKIDEYGLRYVFNEIEMPLIPILTQMEEWGVIINREKLQKLTENSGRELEELTKEIYELAGKPFNINSPKQLGQILFEELEIESPKIRKTAGGARSTSEQVLSEIKDAHPIVRSILEYRETFKMRSTYFEPLAELLSKDGRIRTHFLQTGTATGRLSSEKPNLQNVPQASKWAESLRETFEAANGWSLLSFDYSQLELRILADLSDDPKLKEAFLNDQDIHQLTASQVFDVSFDKVTPEMRRLGKTLNFGIVYGMGSLAFSEQSGLPRAEAQKFIEEYYKEFPQVRIWQEKTKAEARTFGFVKNKNGRRRWLREIISGNPRLIAEAERKAINMPTQGLGADIIKLAMIESFRTLEKKGWLDKKIRPILSIHDELLFEVSDDILISANSLIKDLMEKVFPLAIPLKIDSKNGKNWGTMRKIN